MRFGFCEARIFNRSTQPYCQNDETFDVSANVGRLRPFRIDHGLDAVAAWARKPSS